MCVKTIWFCCWAAHAQLADEWRRAVEDELRRSVEVYTQLESVEEAAAYVRRTAQRPTDFVLIRNNRVYVDRSFTSIDKNNRHLQFVFSVARIVELPSVAYAINRFAFGDRHPYPKPRACEASDELELVIAKYHGYGQCGVLIPNMYNFNELGKWNATSRALRRAARIPWERRTGRVFWRGQILAQSKCHRDAGNYARWQALALARRYPKEFDCDCLDGKPCNFRNDTTAPCPALPYDATMRDLHNEPRDKHSKPPIGLGEFGTYKFLLNVPGTISGSYSRHLNVLWRLGAVVLLWESPHVEWYYPALKHGVTHLRVSRADIRGVTSTVRRDAARQFATNGALVHDTFLCADCLVRYFHLVLLAVAARCNTPALFDRTKKEPTDDLLRHLNLVEVRFSSKPANSADNDDEETKSIPYMFLRSVAADLEPNGDWFISTWRPGTGA